MIYKEFATLIKEKRLYLGIKQKKMSSLLGINQSKYSKIEAGIQEPSFVELQLISRILEIDLTSVLKLKEPIKIGSLNFD